MFRSLVALMSPNWTPTLFRRTTTSRVANSATAGAPRTIPSVVGLWD